MTFKRFTIILIVAVVAVVFFNPDSLQPTPPAPAEPHQPKPSPEPAVVSITVSAVGDVTLGCDHRFAGAANSFTTVARQQSSNPGYFFEEVRQLLEEDDLSIANLEGGLTTATARAPKGHQERPFWFKGLPSYTHILKQGSIEAVNLANNHSHDFGEQGYSDTIETLNEAEIESFGYERVLTQTIKGIDIALVGFNPLGPLERGTNQQVFTSKAANRILDLKEDHNLVIVNLHWGTEFSPLPEPEQVELAEKLVLAGADLVLGHHPHVIQGLQRHEGKHIVYSLGNFVFGGNRGLRDDAHSMIYQETFTFENGELAGTNYRIIPVYYSSSRQKNDYRPQLIPEAEREDFRQKLHDRTVLLNQLVLGRPPESVEKLAEFRQHMAEDERTYDLPERVPPKQLDTAPAEALIDVTRAIPELVYEPIYYTSNNVTGERLYYRTFPYLRVGTARRLLRAQELAQERGYRLKLWDGLRPPETQWALWEHTPVPGLVASPHKAYSTHNRGAAVDVTLVDSDGNNLPMPSDFDDFTGRASRDYPEASKPEIRNALLLESIMTEVGFTTIHSEWWHFADLDARDYEVIDVYAALLDLNIEVPEENSTLSR